MSTDHSAHSGSSHGSVGSYIIGFVIAVVLTVASFMVVVGHSFSASGMLTAISVLAVVQVIVHLIFFLHMNTSTEQKWNNNVFFCAIGFVVILVVGTLFIMNNTAAHMMSR